MNERETYTADPVQVTVMWQATCDACGWHTPPTSPKDVVREWARLHRVTCPLKPAAPGSTAATPTDHGPA